MKMELWVRSQDKRILQKVDNVYLNANYDNRRICTIDSSDYENDLGEYKSKERALEVLDEIQKLLQPQTFINYEDKLEFHPEYIVQNIIKTIPKTEIKELSTFVYQMPKE